MISDGLAENLNGWLFLLSGTWGVLLLPFAISFYSEKRYRRTGTGLVMLVGLYCLILIHDVNAHFNNTRPWVPFYEWCFGVVFPDEIVWRIASAPFDGEKVTMTVSHGRRGKHCIGLWVPDKIEDFTPTGADVELACTFLDKKGDPVFRVRSNNAHKKFWSWCRNDRGGSESVYCIYSVREDVPLDDELTLQIDVSGNVEEFLRLYPGALLIVEKYTDK